DVGVWLALLLRRRERRALAADPTGRHAREQVGLAGPGGLAGDFASGFEIGAGAGNGVGVHNAGIKIVQGPPGEHARLGSEVALDNVAHEKLTNGRASPRGDA